MGVELTRDLRDYCDAVAFSKRDPDPEEHARLTKEFLTQIEESGFLLDANKTGQIRVVDPARETEEQDANRDLVVAKAARRKFLEENAEKIEAEKLLEESGRFRAATEAGDIDTVNEILASRSVQTKNTPTSNDLPD